jgi:hypothetical protein
LVIRAPPTFLSPLAEHDLQMGRNKFNGQYPQWLESCHYASAPDEGSHMTALLA